jgi:hypothetical protein
MTYQGTPNLEEFFAVWDRFLSYKGTLSRFSMHMEILEEIKVMPYFSSSRFGVC